MPFGISSGAGAIFGVTGGVTEAVLRRVLGKDNIASAQDIIFNDVRGDASLKEATITIGERVVKIAIVSGLKNADDLMKEIQANRKYYDFVEVMACRRGCIAGGGQPLPIGPRTKLARFEGLYKIDRESQIKFSQENPYITSLYEGLLQGKTHKLLHRNKH